MSLLSLHRIIKTGASHMLLVFSFMVFLVFFCGCNAENNMIDEQELDISQFDVLALDISGVTDKSDVLFLGKDGSFLLCDANCGQGYGEITYGPNLENKEESISIFIGENGIPKMASYKGRRLFFNRITEDGSDLVMFDEEGEPIIAYNEIISEESAFADLTKASFSTWTNSWKDFANSAIHWSWDDEQKKALGAFAWKVVSFTSTAFGTLSLGPLDIMLFINTAFSEFEKSEKGYGPKTGFLGLEETITAKLLIAKEKGWQHAAGIPLDILSDYFNGLSELELETLSGFEKQFSDFSELKEYYLKLKYGGIVFSGTSRNVVNIYCGPSEGYYYVTADTKSTWWYEYDGINGIGDEWFSVKRIVNNGKEQIEIHVNNNELPEKRKGVINVLTPGRGDAYDDILYKGKIILEQLGNNDYFHLSTYSLFFPEEGGEKTINVEKKSEQIDYFWAWGEPDWCKIDYVQNNADILSVTVDRYDGSRENNGRFNVSTREKNNRFRTYDYSVSITQATQKDDSIIRNKLIQFYKDTNGDNWIHNDNWCSERPISEWWGVRIDSDNRVRLLMDGNGLYGNIDLHDCDFISEIRIIDGEYDGIPDPWNNHIFSADLSNCVNLKYCYLDGEASNSVVNPSLQRVDLHGCEKLKILEISGDNVKDVIIEGCNNIEHVKILGSSIGIVDLSFCTKLKGMNIEANSIIYDFNVPNELESISLKGVSLNTLSLSTCSKLKLLSLDNCSVGSVLINHNNELKNVNVYESNFDEFSVLDCYSLQGIWFNDNTWFDTFFIEEALDKTKQTLSSLIVNNCPTLNYLGANLKMGLLSINDCHNIERIEIGEITATDTIDLSGLPYLSYFSIDYAKNLTFLDLSTCSLLTVASGIENVTNVDLHDCTSITSVGCAGGRTIESLNVSGCTSLESLFVYESNLRQLDVSNCSRLEHLDCRSSLLHSIDVSSCPSLKYLSCWNTHIVQQITIENRIQTFNYDQLYDYRGFVDDDGIYHSWRRNNYGWYYEGEPEKGYHGE